MQNPKTPARQHLTGKALIGFNSKAPRAPSAMVGQTREIKPAS